MSILFIIIFKRSDSISEVLFWSESRWASARDCDAASLSSIIGALSGLAPGRPQACALLGAGRAWPRRRRGVAGPAGAAVGCRSREPRGRPAAAQRLRRDLLRRGAACRAAGAPRLRPRVGRTWCALPCRPGRGGRAALGGARRPRRLLRAVLPPLRRRRRPSARRRAWW